MLSLFFGLGVLPLLVLGGVSYRQSMDSVEELLATETTFIAQRIARELENRYARYQSDLTLLAENDVWFIPVDPMLGPAPVTESEGQINSFVLSPGGQRIAYSP